LRSGPPPDERSDDERARNNARSTARRRLLRRQLLGHDELFGEPAWQMLLDLFIHDGDDVPLSMSALSAAAGIPSSSAMKLVQRLCDAGLLERTIDMFDRRRSLVRLAPEVAHKLRAYFAEGTE
jgi:DNA repair protein RadC